MQKNSQENQKEETMFKTKKKNKKVVISNINSIGIFGEEILKEDKYQYGIQVISDEVTLLSIEKTKLLSKKAELI